MLLNSLSRRRGVSLLEILISIGVVGVGLLGVASLMPIAHQQTDRALRRDRTTSMAQRAFREFKVRGFDQPTVAGNLRWFFYPPITITDPVTKQAVINKKSLMPDALRIETDSYCFDPIFYGYQPIANPQFPHVFPSAYNDANGNRQNPPFAISRVTGMSFPGSGLPMSFAQASAVCNLQDDLGFELIDLDGRDVRFQKYQATINSATPDFRAKRQSGDTFSWMVTLAPRLQLNRISNVPSVTNPRNLMHEDRYLMSVAVFNNRQVFSAATITSVRPNQEIVAAVAPPAVYLPSSGNPPPATTFAGSSVREIQLVPPRTDFAIWPKVPNWPYTEENGVTFDRVRPGTWLGIGQRFLNPEISVLHWVKVISKPDVQYLGNVKTFIVTVEGPEFRFVQRNPEAPMDPNFASLIPIPTYAIFASNLENVFEKTIKITNGTEFN